MAEGDVIKGSESVAADGYVSIQPAAGVMWSIQCIEANGPIEIYAYDGTNQDLVDSNSTAPSRFVYGGFLCTNTSYYRVKNVSDSALRIWYSGIDVTPI